MAWAANITAFRLEPQTLLTVVAPIEGDKPAPIMTATSSFAPFLADENAGIEGINALIEGAGALAFVLGPALGAVVASTISLDAVFYEAAGWRRIGLTQSGELTYERTAER